MSRDTIIEQSRIRQMKHWTCQECGEDCHVIEDEFDCHGPDGRLTTHKTGDYYSECCEAEAEPK